MNCITHTQKLSNGVFITQWKWSEFVAGLPGAPVYELDYDAVDDVLLAGTLGRGAWLVRDASTA